MPRLEREASLAILLSSLLPGGEFSGALPELHFGIRNPQYLKYFRKGEQD
jgi:hypothetical protein